MKPQGRSGINPLSYRGVNPDQPPNVVFKSVAPTSDNFVGFYIGDFWMVQNQSTGSAPYDELSEIWVLVNVENDFATWVQLYPSAFGVNMTIVANSGSANAIGDAFNLLGGTQWTSDGDGNFTITNRLDNGTDGQLLIGGGANPTWASVVSGDATVTLTPGANALGLDVTGNFVIQYDTDSGSAIPVAGLTLLSGGSNITTTGAASTATINLDDDVVIPGTLTVSSLNQGVVQSDATGLLFADNGNDGQTLIGGGAAPAWANITSSGGTITITNGPNSIDLSVNTPPSGNRHGFLGVLNDGGSTQNLTNNDLGSFASNHAPLPFLTWYSDGSSFYAGNGAGARGEFTAPATGYFYLMCTARMINVNLNPSVQSFTAYLRIVTPARTYTKYITLLSSAGDSDPFSTTMAVVADLTLNDVVYWNVEGVGIPGGASFRLRGTAVDLVASPPNGLVSCVVFVNGAQLE